MTSQYHNIPKELRALKQFCLWLHEGKTKVPYQTNGKHARVNDESTWCSFEEAVAAVHLYDGIGYFFKLGGGYAGIDLDSSRKILDEAKRQEADQLQRQIYDAFNSYSELSPSGEGCHIIIKATLESGCKRSDLGVELYSHNRFFTMTGKVVRDAPIAERQKPAESLWAYLKDNANEKQQSTHASEMDTINEPYKDAEIIEQASKAANGVLFQQLFKGDWQGCGRYPSQSEADSAFVCIVAFYTPARNQISRIYKQSALAKVPKPGNKKPRGERADYIDWLLKGARIEQPQVDVEKDWNKVQEAIAASKAKSQNLPTVSSEPIDVDANSYDEDNFFDFVSNPMNLHSVGALLADLRDWITNTSPIYQNEDMSLASAISIISTLAGRRFGSPTGCTLNLYMIMLAGTGVAKNRPIQAPNDVFIEIGKPHLCAGAFASSSALEQELARSPCILASIDEVANLLFARTTNKSAFSYKSALSGVLRKLWTIGFRNYIGLNTVKDKGAANINMPHFGILGASVAEEFFKALGGQGNMDNGLYNRLTIPPIGPSVKRIGRAPMQPKLDDGLKDHLRRVGAVAVQRNMAFQANQGPQELPPQQIDWADEVAQANQESFRDAIDERSVRAPAIAPIVRRTAEQAVRFATIRAISRESEKTEVIKEDVYWGVSFAVASAKVAIASALKHMTENAAQANYMKIKNYLDDLWKSKGGNNVTRRDLIRKVKGAIPELDRIIRALEGEGFLQEEKTKVGTQGGRPSLRLVKMSKIR